MLWVPGGLKHGYGTANPCRNRHQARAWALTFRWNDVSFPVTFPQKRSFPVFVANPIHGTGIAVPPDIGGKLPSEGGATRHPA